MQNNNNNKKKHQKKKREAQSQLNLKEIDQKTATFNYLYWLKKKRRKINK